MDKDKKEQLDVLIGRALREHHFSGFLIGVKSQKTEEAYDYGFADPNSGMKMKKDTIFRLYSMSKPICAVAVWILMERGKLSRHTLLSDIFPEFRNMERWENDTTVPVRKPICISDLLNMTAGFTYDDDDRAGRETGMLFKCLHDAIDAGKKIPTREVVKMIADRPLAHEPGERWRYGLCADILGAVIEEVDGRRLGKFYQDEIFGPLGMKDTGFYVPQEKNNRFAPLFCRKPENGGYRLFYDREHHLGLGDFLSPPAFESAGAGLVSTYNDYMKFSWMLACGGSLNGARILSGDTVASFAQNQLTKEQTEKIYFRQMKGYGYGNLMRVCLEGENAPVPGMKQAFGWDGWCGPYMTVDIKRQRALAFFFQTSGYAQWDLTAEILRLFM